MDLAARIEQLIEPTATDLGLEIVRVRMMGSKTPTLQIMAERPDGTMDVEACAKFSRAISALLDVEDPIDSEYTLEVSSPGIDRPLTRLKDFGTWTGHEAKIELARTVDGRKRFRGKLLPLDEENIGIELADAPGGPLEVRIPFDAIGDAKLVLTDELLAAAAPQADPDTFDEDFDLVEQDAPQADEPLEE